MAYSVRVEAIKWPATSPMLRLEPPWWDAKVLQKDPRFVDIEDTPGYWDCQALLTIQEFKELHDRFKKEAAHGLWSSFVRADAPDPMVVMLDAVLELLKNEDDRFRVTAFEWYSGF